MRRIKFLVAIALILTIIGGNASPVMASGNSFKTGCTTVTVSRTIVTVSFRTIPPTGLGSIRIGYADWPSNEAKGVSPYAYSWGTTSFRIPKKFSGYAIDIYLPQVCGEAELYVNRWGTKVYATDSLE